MFRKNTAGQFIHFQGVDATSGGIKSGVTWTVRRCIDGTFAATTGTVTEDGTAGWYKLAMSQADTNGNDIGFNFTGTGAVPQTVNIITTAADPTDGVRFGLTALPNAIAAAIGGLLTAPTTANVGLADLSRILGTALTETAGQIAGAFKQFFNVATPTGSVNSLPNAVAGASGGVLISGGNAGTTTFGALTVTGATTLTGAVTANNAGNAITGVTAAVTGDFSATMKANFPTNWAALGITAGGKISEVVLTDTVTTYTGNTPQTGDAFARIGVNGAGLTALGDARLSNLDAAVSSRMATYTQPTGFLAAAFPSVVGDATAANQATINGNVLTRAAPGDAMALTTAAQQAAADTLLGRNVAGGADGGRMVKEAFYVLRNKVDTGAGVVYGTDDVTPAFNFTVQTAAGNPITVFDPA